MALDAAREEARAPDRAKLGSEIPRILDRLEAVEKRFVPIVYVERDRRTDEVPLFTWGFGPLRFFAAASGAVATGSSKKFLLTTNGFRGGKALFSEMPDAAVYICPGYAASGQLIESARKPVGPLRPLTITCDEDAAIEYDLSWDADNQHWSLSVTNSTGSSQEFFVQARGVYYGE